MGDIPAQKVGILEEKSTVNFALITPAKTGYRASDATALF